MMTKFTLLCVILMIINNAIANSLWCKLKLNKCLISTSMPSSSSMKPVEKDEKKK